MNIEKNMDGKGMLQCPHCWKRFKSKKLLNQHIRVKHHAQPEIRKTNLRCPDETCNFLCYRHVDLRVHVALKHSCFIDKVTMCFSTLPEFQLWKMQEEKLTGSLFMKHTSGKKLRKDVIKEYYRCHHSKSHSPSAQRKLMQKKELKQLVVVSCPATIEVQKMADGSIEVTYFKNHFGHKTQSTEQTTLSADDCKLIAQKLKDGMPVNELLFEIKKSSTLSKALTKKELYHVAKKSNLFKLKPRQKRCLPPSKNKESSKQIPSNEISPKLKKADVISKLKYAALLAECTTTSDDTVGKIDGHISKVIEILQEAHVKTFEADTLVTGEVVASNLPVVESDAEEVKAAAKRNTLNTTFDHSYALELQKNMNQSYSSDLLDHNYASGLPVFDHSYASDLQKFYTNSVSELFDHSYALEFQGLDNSCTPYLSPLPCFDHSYASDFQDFDHSYACEFDHDLDTSL